MPASRVLAVSPIEQVERYGDPRKVTGSLDQAACREAGACHQASRRHHHGAGPRAHRLVRKDKAPRTARSKALKRTLLHAKSIAYVDPASGGTSARRLRSAIPAEKKLGVFGGRRVDSPHSGSGHSFPGGPQIVSPPIALCCLRPKSQVRDDMNGGQWRCLNYLAEMSPP
jgi:hypothetical protein